MGGESSPYAEEGTVAHETLYTALGMDNPFDVNFTTDEEEKALPVAFEWVETMLTLYSEAKLHREIAVDPKRFVRTTHCKGTADIIIPVEFGPLIVADYKHGIGVVVEAIDNTQLLLYALGALDRFEKLGYIFTEIVMVVIQPRAYHPSGPIREWRITYKEAMNWAKFLASRAHEALGPNPIFRPSEDACRFCPAAGVCRHLAEYALGKARTVFKSIVDYEAEYKDINTLSNVEMGHILDQSKTFRKWLDEVYNHAMRYEMKGGIVPGWGLTEKKSNRRWAVSPEELYMLYGDLVVEKKVSFLSPAQAEKVIDKKEIAKLTVRDKTGYALTQMDTPTVKETHDTSPFTEVDDDGKEVTR
jgi:hypothetical protein